MKSSLMTKSKKRFVERIKKMIEGMHKVAAGFSEMASATKTAVAEKFGRVWDVAGEKLGPLKARIRTAWNGSRVGGKMNELSDKAHDFVEELPGKARKYSPFNLRTNYVLSRDRSKLPRLERVMGRALDVINDLTRKIKKT